jgi:hypothetical protein
VPFPLTVPIEPAYRPVPPVTRPRKCAIETRDRVKVNICVSIVRQAAVEPIDSPNPRRSILKDVDAAPVFTRTHAPTNQATATALAHRMGLFSWARRVAATSFDERDIRPGDTSVPR